MDPSEPTKSQAIAFHQIDFPQQQKTLHILSALSFSDDLVEWTATAFYWEKAISSVFANYNNHNATVIIELQRAYISDKIKQYSNFTPPYLFL